MGRTLILGCLPPPRADVGGDRLPTDVIRPLSRHLSGSYVRRPLTLRSPRGRPGCSDATWACSSPCTIGDGDHLRPALTARSRRTSWLP